MPILFAVFAFIFGTLFASAINALDWRFDTGASWLTDRSQCPHCGNTLRWYELVPLFSFAVQRGRCRNCEKRIAWQYPLVELAGGGLFLLSFLYFSVGVAVVSALTLTILLFIYLYDCKRYIIPDMAVWSFNALAFVLLFFDVQVMTAVIPDWQALAAGPITSLPLFLIWLFSGGRAMGFGDVKLALGVGWFLGISGGLSALTFAFWIGAVVSLTILAGEHVWKSHSRKTSARSTMNASEAPTDESKRFSGRLTLKSAVPFGPFIILGFLLNFFLGLSLF